MLTDDRGCGASVVVPDVALYGEGLSAGETGVELVPVSDFGFAQAPAKANFATVNAAVKIAESISAFEFYP